LKTKAATLKAAEEKRIKNKPILKQYGVKYNAAIANT
jgi:hypothetical protein